MRCRPVQWHKVVDDKQAAALVVDLLTLAPLVSGKEGSKALQSCCAFFSVASFAASLLLKALIDSYNEAAARHRAGSMAPADKSLAFLAAHAKAGAHMLESAEPVSRMAMLLSSKQKGDRVRWEMMCAKAILSSARQIGGKVMAGCKEECQRVTVHSYKAMTPLVDRHDALSELLHMCGEYGPVGQGWSQQLRSSVDERASFHLMLDLLCSAPLAHARVHRALFERFSLENSVSVKRVLMQLEGKPCPGKHASIAPNNKELGLSMQDGKFGNGRSIFNTYADLEVRRADDTMVQAHDDEWTQMGRINAAQRSIEAKLRVPHMDEMSGGINGSMFFSMAAVEKKLEQKIPAPVYPDMRRNKLASLSPSAPVPLQEAVSKQQVLTRPAWGVSFADVLRKSESFDKPLAVRGATPTIKNSDSLGSKLDQQPMIKLDQHKPAPPKASVWASHAPVAAFDLGEARKGVWGKTCATVSLDPTPLPSAWGQRKTWGTAAPCSAAQAAQAATGVLFTEHSTESYNAKTPENHQDHHVWAIAAQAPAHVDSSQSPLDSSQSPQRAPESFTNNHTSSPGLGCQERVRYNPLRPQHTCMQVSGYVRLATAKRLTTEIEDFLRQVEPTEQSRRHRDDIVLEVTAAVRDCWPDARVEVYGSFATDLFLPHSDVDLLVMKAQASENKSALQIVSERLRCLTWCRYMKPIQNASVPVVKLTADVSLLPSANLPDAALAPRYPFNLEHLQQQHQVEQPCTAAEACIAVDVTLDCNIGDAPIALRDFVIHHLDRLPMMRGLVLVLKHFMFQQGLNDAYKGGLTSHSLILLLIFYFNIPEVWAAYEAALDPESEGYIDKEWWYGEWLMRVMQWLSEFPFSDVGIVVEPMSYVPLTNYGFGILTTGECDPELPDLDASGIAMARSKAQANLLHIEDPFNKGNIAKGSFEWCLVRRTLQAAYHMLRTHEEPSPLLRIYGGVAEGKSPLAAILDRAHVAARVDALLKHKTNKHMLTATF